MKLILQILALIALIIGAMFLFAVAKMFTPKHAGAPIMSATSTTTTSTIQTATTTEAIDVVATSTVATSTVNVNLNDLIQVKSPKLNTTVSSPLKVAGQARGNWYFEASFPITIVDWDGKIIGQGPVQAKGDWMTTNFVPFEGTINFTKPECAAGTDYCKRGAVIFKKDNPSGLPQNDASVEIPVVFQ